MLSLWRYLEGTKNFDGWHVTADPSGCGELISIITDLDRERSVVVTPPTRDMLRVPNNRGGTARWQAPRKLVLAPDANERLWRAEEGGNHLRLTFGSARRDELRKGFEDIRRGQGDYAIGPDEEALWSEMCLWFWWMPGAPALRY